MIEVLRRAKEIVEAGWCKGAIARNARGERVEHDDPSAVCYCMYGAILKACAEKGVKYSAPVGLGNLVDYNDSYYTKKSDILGAFDKAINACLQQQKV